MSGGRPTKLTAELIDTLCRYLSEGLPYRIVCDLSGISYPTFRQWQNGNFPERTSKKLRGEFLDRLKKAEAEAFRELYLTIRNASVDQQIPRAVKGSPTYRREGQWVAAAWILERRYPEYFAKRTEITGAGGSPLQLEQMVNKAAETHGLSKADIMAEAARLLEGVDDE